MQRLSWLMLASGLMQAQATPAGYASICTGDCVCRSGGSSNVIPRLPRVDRSLTPISSDLGSYDFLDCNENSTTFSCSLAALPSISQLQGSHSVPGSYVQYAEGILMYSVLALACAIACVAFCCAFVINRYICCCCSPTGKCGCCRCGGPYPTRRTCCMGVRDVEMSLAAAGASGSGSERYKYAKWERAATWGLMAVFAVLMSVFIVIGNASGMQAIPTAAQDAAPRLTGAIAPYVKRIVASGERFVIAAASNVLAPQLLELNITIQSGISLPTVQNSLDCVLWSIDALPDINDVASAANQVNQSLLLLNTTLPLLIREVRGLASQKGNASGSISQLSAIVATQLTPALTTAQNALTSVNASLADLSARRATFLWTATGVDSDLQALTQAALPSSDSLLLACGPPAATDLSIGGSLNRAINGIMNGNSTDSALLASHLRSVNESLSSGLGSVNFSRTANQLSSMTTAANSVRTFTIPNLLTALDAADAALGALPRSATLMPLVDALNSAAVSFDVNNLVDYLQQLDAAVRALPNITTLLTMLDNVQQVAQVVPCANAVVSEIAQFNATLVRLPVALDGAFAQLQGANDTVNSAMATVRDVQARLRAAQAQIDSVNISSYIDQATNAGRSINASVASFNFTAVSARINEIDTSVANVNFTSLRNAVRSLNSTLSVRLVNASTLEQLREFDAYRIDLMRNLTTSIQDVQAVSQGYCSTSMALCTSSDQCGAGNCRSIGTYRCRANPSMPCNSSDSDCPPTDVCLVDASRATALKIALEGVAIAPAGQIPDVSDTRMQLGSTVESLNGVNIAGMTTRVADAQTAALAVAPTSILDNLQALNTSLFAFDTATITAQLDNIETTVAGVAFRDFNGQLDSINATVGEMRSSQRKMVQQARDSVFVISNLLNVRMASYVASLSQVSLQSAQATGGAVGLISSVLGIVEDAWNQVAYNLTFAGLSPLSLVHKLPNTTIAKITSTGAYAGYIDAGVVNWVMSLVAGSSIVAVGDARASQIFTDVDGNTYPNHRLCLTDACIARTAAFYSSQTIGSLSNGIVPLSLAPLALMSLLWVFPLAATLCAWCSLASPCACRNPRWQKVPASCMLGCVLGQLPCCLMLAALLWPAVMMIGDICASGPNVGYAMVLQQQDAICSMVSGDRIGDTCYVTSSFNLPDGSASTINASINAAVYYRTLLGDACPPLDPWSPTVSWIASQLKQVPYAQASYFLEPSRMETNLGIVIQPTLATAIYNTTNVTGEFASQWLMSTSGDVLSCAAVHAPLHGTLDAVCCTLFDPVYWLGSSIFLLCWFMCCCGLPAGILGRKRLPSKPWGPIIDRDRGAVSWPSPRATRSGRRGRTGPDAALAVNPLYQTATSSPPGSPMRLGDSPPPGPQQVPAVGSQQMSSTQAPPTIPAGIEMANMHQQSTSNPFVQAPRAAPAAFTPVSVATV